MAKVEGSSPFIRFPCAPAIRARGEARLARRRMASSDDLNRLAATGVPESAAFATALLYRIATLSAARLGLVRAAVAAQNRYP